MIGKFCKFDIWARKQLWPLTKTPTWKKGDTLSGPGLHKVVPLHTYWHVSVYYVSHVSRITITSIGALGSDLSGSSHGLMTHCKFAVKATCT